MHLGHRGLTGSEAKEEAIRRRIIPVDCIQHRRLRIERNIASYCHRHLGLRPNIARAPKSVGADTKRRMVFRDAQKGAVLVAKERILVDQLQPRIKIIPIQKAYCRFRDVAI